MRISRTARSRYASEYSMAAGMVSMVKPRLASAPNLVARTTRHVSFSMSGGAEAHCSGVAR
eukprot:926828-Prymnesium_polylepis.1